MKWRDCFGPALAFALAVAPVTAMAQTTTAQPPPRQQPQAERQQTAHQQHEVIRADQFIGQTIRSRENDRLGRIDDLALNVKDGRIAYVVVNRGGLWGIGGETVALPWQQLQPDQAERAVRLSESQLQQARRIDTSRGWPTAIGEEPVGTTGTERQQTVLPMSRIVGMDVENKQGENIGRIDEVALSRDGAASYAVIAHGGFLGMGDNYVAVPWDRLTVDRERETAVLDVTKQQLESASRFERDRWPARVDWPFGGGR